MQVGDLERALALNRVDDRHWSVVADPDHESVNAMYGGWTVGVMLGAVEQAAMGGDATPSAITANFVKRIEPGSEVGISVRRLDGSRSVSHWLAEMSSLGGAETLAISSIVLSAPRPSDGHMQATMPDAPDPETLEVFHPPGSQGAQVVMRPHHRIPSLWADRHAFHGLGSGHQSSPHRLPAAGVSGRPASAAVVPLG